MSKHAKIPALFAIAAAAAGISFGAETTVNYPESPLPFSGATSSLEANISGDTNSSIVVVGSDAQVGVQGQDAVTVNYNSGTTLHYLSTIGASGEINGNVNINVYTGSFNNQTSSPAITEALIGTAYGASAAVINGNVNVEIKDGDFYGNIFAGGGATVKGDTSLVISGGTFSAEDGVFGGNSWGGVTEGNASLKITGGDFSNANVYAGNHRTGSSFSQNVIKGSASLIIEGGSFKNLNGGSTDGSLEKNKLAGKVEGDTSLVIRANDAITISGDINVASGFVDGDAEVTFVGDAGKLSFNGTLKASSASGEIGGLSGKASINIGTADEAFSGEFNGTINDGFALLQVSNADTSVSFAEAFDVDALVVDANSSVLLAENTKFDTLNLVFDSEFDTGANLGAVLDDIFGASAGIVVSAISQKADGFVVTNLDGAEFSAFIGEDGSVEVGAAVPEPAAFAALFGAAALAFAAVRRRK